MASQLVGKISRCFLDAGYRLIFRPPPLLKLFSLKIAWQNAAINVNVRLRALSSGCSWRVSRINTWFFRGRVKARNPWNPFNSHFHPAESFAGEGKARDGFTQRKEKRRTTRRRRGSWRQCGERWTDSTRKWKLVAKEYLLPTLV